MNRMAFGKFGYAPLACLLLAAAMVATTGVGADAADQTLKLTVGQEATVELEENPSTGYRWTIDAKAGVNASILRIDDRGFSQDTSGKRLLGAPGIHRWSIAADERRQRQRHLRLRADPGKRPLSAGIR